MIGMQDGSSIFLALLLTWNINWNQQAFFVNIQINTYSPVTVVYAVGHVTFQHYGTFQRKSFTAVVQ